MELRYRAPGVEGSLDNKVSTLFVTHWVRYVAPLSWSMRSIPSLEFVFPIHLANGCWLLELGAILTTYGKWHPSQARDAGDLPLNTSGSCWEV